MQQLLETVQPIIDAITAAGGHPLIVGGALRDVLLGFEPKDIDIEVYRLAPDQLVSALATVGSVVSVGRSFGILKLRLPGGYEVDVAPPQRRSHNAGQRGLAFTPDMSMTPQQAAARRDFTFNAMALTPGGELLDFFGGQADLERGIIHHVSDLFGEDPLRVLRAMQFAARFNMRLAPATAEVCRSLLAFAPGLPRERVWVEWHKWATRGAFPSVGLRTLHESGWTAAFPELAALVDCPQDPVWHPEGDVWVHTGYVCDAAYELALGAQLPDDERAVLLFAALCHDLGKPATTAVADDGRIRSPGHAGTGVELARTLLERIGAPRAIGEHVLPLVQEHMSHIGLEPTPRTVRRLAVRLAPATITAWRLLVAADASGRPPLPPADPGEPIADLAAQLGAASGRQAPLISGRDVLERGITSGPRIGQILRDAYAAQVDGLFEDRAAGLAWLDAYLATRP
jgi:tRNA nucleotidyltransferase (CCA-adding enzyme)